MITYDDAFEIELSDTAATMSFATNIAKSLVPGVIIYLRGDLGAGKTTLVRGILLELGYASTIKSPTFTLVESYEFAQFIVYHFDLYRLSDPTELEFIGIRDYLTEAGVCIFEWADKGLGHVPAADLEINLDFQGKGRIAAVRANSDQGRKVLQDLAIE